MEIEKGRGFVTFSKTEATDRAIVEVSGDLIPFPAALEPILFHNSIQDARKDD